MKNTRRSFLENTVAAAALSGVARSASAQSRANVTIGIIGAGIRGLELMGVALEAGAAYVTPITLHLRGEVRDLWFEWLREHRPDLIPRYERLYRRSAYAPKQ